MRIASQGTEQQILIVNRHCLVLSIFLVILHLLSTIFLMESNNSHEFKYM